MLRCPVRSMASFMGTFCRPASVTKPDRSECEIPLQSRELRAPLHNMTDRLSGKRLDGPGFADRSEEGAGLHAGGGQLDTLLARGAFTNRPPQSIKWLTEESYRAIRSSTQVHYE